MTARPWLKPLPLALAALFLAVAGVDLVHSLRQGPPPLPDLVRKGVARFTMAEPVVELRRTTAAPAVEVLPVPTGFGAEWSAATASGRWLLESSAAFELELTRGGYRTMVVEARAAATDGEPLAAAVLVDDIPCGELRVGPTWGRHVVELPSDGVGPGVTRIALELPSPDGARRRRRVLQLRRVGLLLAADAAPGDLARRPPVTLDAARDRVVLRAPGVLELPFTMDERIDALSLRYRFGAEGASAQLTLSRPDGGGAGRDEPVRRELTADGRRAGRIRIPLHGRRGPFVFRAEVAPGPELGRLDLVELRLVSEDRSADPTEAPRPRARRTPRPAE